MIAVIATVIGMTVIGLPVTLAIDRDVRRGALVGLSFLYGGGAVYLVMLLLPWRLPLIVLTLLAISAIAWSIARRSHSERAAEAGGATPVSPALRVLSAIADALTLLTLAGYAFFATLARPWEWDFAAVWGLKARVFFEHGGIDWRFLESRWNDFQHSEYPLLLPFHFDFVALLSGGWNDRWLGLLFVAYAGALVLIVREMTARELPSPFPALITLVMAGLACTRYVGMAEGPFIAFATAAILLLRSGRFVHAAMLFGFAATSKQEGLTLLMAAVAALVVARRWRDAVRLWPAAVIAAPWWIFVFEHHLRSYLATSGVLDRAITRLAQSWDFAMFLFTWTPDGKLWIVILVAILVARGVDRRREAPYLLLLALQVAAILFAYLTTPYGVQWHIATSWPRLERQIIPAATWLALLLLAKTFVRENNHAHAEARPDL